jgi:hypothetical protein
MGVCGHDLRHQCHYQEQHGQPQMGCTSLPSVSVNLMFSA